MLRVESSLCADVLGAVVLVRYPAVIRFKTDVNRRELRCYRDRAK